jgi:hypothetical protein
MPGIPTHFKILEISNNKLGFVPKDDNGRPSGYAYLGAIGASLGDFIPNKWSKDAKRFETTEYWKVWNEIFAIFFGYNPKDKTPKVSEDSTLIEALWFIQRCCEQSELQKIKEHNRDAFILQDGNLMAFRKACESLKNHTDLLNINSGLFERVGEKIFNTVNANKFKSDSTTRPHAPPPKEFPVRDLLHWRKTGIIFNAMKDNLIGEKSNEWDYLWGYLTSYVGKVCGNPFINSRVGGSYRNLWWRHRYISNFVDTWVYNFVNSWEKNDKPTNEEVSEARLNDRLAKIFKNENKLVLEVPGEEVKEMNNFKNVKEIVRILVEPGYALPKEYMLDKTFCKFWFDSMKIAYGNKALSSKLKNDDDDEDLEPEPNWIKIADDDESCQLVLSYAALQAWLILWFQTGSGIEGLKKPIPPEGMPPGCPSAPSWEKNPDGTINRNIGDGPTLPEMASPPDDNEETVCAAIAAIFAAMAAYAKSIFLGGAAIGALIAAFSEDDDPPPEKWDELICAMYWFNWYRHGFTTLMHEVLMKAGFAFPYIADLTQYSNNVLSRSLSDEDIGKVSANFSQYPVQQPNKILKMSSWAQDPFADNPTGESPPTTPFRDNAKTPDFFINDKEHKIPQTAGVKGIFIPLPGISSTHMFLTEKNVSAPFSELSENIGMMPARTGTTFENLDYFFSTYGVEGNKLWGEIRSWNLDGDRGLFSWGWSFPDHTKDGMDAWDMNNIRVEIDQL